MVRGLMPSARTASLLEALCSISCCTTGRRSDRETITNAQRQEGYFTTSHQIVIVGAPLLGARDDGRRRAQGGHKGRPSYGASGVKHPDGEVVGEPTTERGLGLVF